MNRYNGLSQDRNSVALDELSDALGALESQLGLGGRRQSYGVPADDMDMVDEIRARQQQLSAPRRQHPNAGAQPPRRAHTDDLRRELHAMREELARERNAPSAASFQQAAPRPSQPNGEMAALKADIESLKNDVMKLAREDSIRDLTDRWSVLEQEFGQLPAKLGSRDDILAVADRISVLQDAVSTLPQSSKIDAIDHQLHTLASAIEQLAYQSQTNTNAFTPAHLDALDSRLEEVSQAIAAMARNNGQEDAFNRLEARIAALGDQVQSSQAHANHAAPQFDTSHLEAHINALATRLDAVHDAASNAYSGKAFDDVNRRLAALADAVSQVAARASGTSAGVDPAIETMAARLDEIAAKIAGQEMAASQTADTITSALDQRMQELADYLDKRQPAQGGEPINTDRLESRMNDIAAMLAEHRSEPAPDSFFNALDERMQALSYQMEQRQPAAADSGHVARIEERINELAGLISNVRAHDDAAPSTDAFVNALDERMQALVDHLDQRQPVASGTVDVSRIESRLADLASMLDRTEQSTGTAVDLSGLEQQITSLSQQLSSVAHPTGNDMLIDRLSSLEERLARGEDDIMAAASQAAQVALSQMAPGQDRDMMQALAERLSELDALARDSNDRNSQTFEAIHDTLLKVVDHLAGLESAMEAAPQASMAAEQFRAPAPAQAEAQKVEVADAPPMAFEPVQPANTVMPPLVQAPKQAQAQARPAARSPRQAAELAAMAALNNDETMTAIPDPVPSAAAPKKSVMDNVRSRLGGEVSDGALSSADVDDTMLEPGSGTPDLASILQRVRDENNQPRAAAPSVDMDSSKSDFIAAARRAAKAAAADMTIAENNQNAGEKAGRFDGLKEVFANRRKPILMGAGAILLAILAIPAISSLFGGGGDDAELAFNEPTPIIEQQAEPVEGGIDGLGQFAADANAIDQNEASQLDVTPRAVDLSVDESQFNDGVEFNEDGSIDLTTVAPEVPTVEVAATAIPEGVGSVLLQEAVSGGDPMAIFIVGEALAARANGDQTVNAQAADWYLKSAQLGYAPAQYRIGSFYEKGTAGTRDIDEAMLYYQLAADQGNASAMHNLGSLMASGQAGQPDMQSATQWFQRAAELGVRDSQFNLGILRGLGQGVERDLKESYKWFALAAQNGDAIAGERLKEVEAQMTPEELDLAKGAVELWQQKPLNQSANSVDVPDSWRLGSERTASAPVDAPPPQDMKKAISNIQAILNNAGYDAGPVDGMMGNKTRQAIIQFQTDNGMAGTGNIDKALVERLLEFNKTASNQS
ncbi:MAG: peptidoglycan-binding protein [Ahrensia sp.]